MTSAVFETEQFRVEITGKTAWFETRENSGWVFSGQHALPVSADFGESNLVGAAISQYEETRGGDQALRAALTGIRTAPAKPPVVSGAPSARTAFRPAASAKPAGPRKAADGYFGFRTPLRPPLMRSEPE